MGSLFTNLSVSVQGPLANTCVSAPLGPQTPQKPGNFTVIGDIWLKRDSQHRLVLMTEFCSAWHAWITVIDEDLYPIPVSNESRYFFVYVIVKTGFSNCVDVIAWLIGWCVNVAIDTRCALFITTRSGPRLRGTCSISRLWRQTITYPHSLT